MLVSYKCLINLFFVYERVKKRKAESMYLIDMLNSQSNDESLDNVIIDILNKLFEKNHP